MYFNRQFILRSLEGKSDDIKEVIRSRKLKDRRCSDQIERTNTDLHYTTQKTTDCATRTHLKPEINSDTKCDIKEVPFQQLYVK